MKCQNCGRRISSRWFGGPPDPLWHGTSSRNLESIREHGISVPSYWGTEHVARYYARGAAAGGGKGIMIAVPLDTLKNCLEPDVRSVEEPITTALGRSEEEVWELWDWEKNDHTWKDSLAAAGSVKCTSTIYPDEFEHIAKL